ncbi:E3 ubiquitin-protein ligase ZFP91 isoform X2 [Sardina pilchardus]|uniref:E3 ubiquitin-protein ligase ZFP91 isoform X2 n=1 Tax=Sardina pilchardus TaxID=27697 RepID=UPI002E135753
MEPPMSETIGNKEERQLAIASEEAAQTSPSQGAVSTPRRALRGRGAYRSKTEVSNSPNRNGAASSTPASGRVLRDRSTRAVPAWRLNEASEDTEEPGCDADSNRRRKPANPRRRRNTAAASATEVVSETGDHSRPATGVDNKRDSAVTRAPRSRRSQAQGRSKTPSTRQSGGSPRMVCKSEPDADASCVVTDKTAGRRAVGKEKKENEDGSERAQVEEEEELSLQADSQDQNLHPKPQRDPHKPRRKPPSRSKEKKEKAPPKEPEIKTEGGESGDVKQENEFGEVAEPPRKRGRRRKDDKSPRLPKRRKKPPVQYVRCEMEGCGTVLAHPRYLQHHIKYQHLLKKKYVCPHPSCGRLFRLQKQLLRHAKHHTDQRDYICEFCARAFKSSHNLAVHRMIHTGEKPLQCEICGFTCRQKASLNWHMKKHDADAFYQFSCGICGKKFEKKDSVVAHKAKSHPEVLIAEALAANAGALITTPGALLEASSSLPVSGVEQQPQQPEAQQVLVVGEDTHTLHTMQVPVTLALQTAAEDDGDVGGAQEHQPSHAPQPAHTHALQMPLQFVSTVAPAGSQAPQIHQLTLHSGQTLVAQPKQQQPQQITLQAYSPQMQTQILHMTFQPVTHGVPVQQQQAHIQQLPLLSATPQQQLTLQPVPQQQQQQQSQALQRPPDPGHPPNPTLLTQVVQEDPTDCQETLGFAHDPAPPSSSPPPSNSSPGREPGDTGVVWEGGENGETGDIGGVWERGSEGGGPVLTHGSEGQVQHGLI